MNWEALGIEEEIFKWGFYTLEFLLADTKDIYFKVCLQLFFTTDFINQQYEVKKKTKKAIF